MEIGTIVKVEIPYKRGETRIGKRYRKGKVVGIYSNFILVEFKEGYRTCYKESELVID